MDLTSESHRRAALEAAKASQQITMTQPVALVQGGQGFLVCCPIYHGEHFKGFILGVFRFDKLFKKIQQYTDWDHDHTRIRVGQDWVLETQGSTGVDSVQRARHQEEVLLYGVPWVIDSSPTDRLLSEMPPSLKGWSLLGGGLMALLLGVMIRLAEVAKTNQHLATELSQRQQAREQFERVVEVSPTALVMVDDQGTILLVNRETENIFGYERGELIGQCVDLLLPQRFRAKHPEHRRSFMNHPQARAMGAGRDLYGMRKNGSEFPIEIGLSPLRTPQGVQVLAAVADITIRKQHEDALANRARELERSNKELDDFAYIASHDLKEPLRGIHNYATFLIEDYQDRLDEDGVSKLHTLQRLSQRMKHLIDTLLTLSRQIPVLLFSSIPPAPIWREPLNATCPRL